MFEETNRQGQSSYITAQFVTDGDEGNDNDNDDILI
jgi:hypothetical protein